MFGDNPFLTKKDSLVEAVRQAQEDGEIRRQAEAIVNEAFGVYNRNAVVREDLAAYDAAIEEAYADLKEGKKEKLETERKETPVGQRPHGPGWTLKKSGQQTNKPNDTWERKYKKVGVNEEKKLADKDYDRDGKVETSKKEVWGSRLRAAKASGKYKGPVDEKKMWEEEKELSSKQKKMAAVAGNPKKIDAPDLAALRAGKKMDEAKGTAAVQNMKHRDFKETRHPNPGAVTKAPVPGVSIAEEDRLDEVSKRTAISAYREKEAQERDTSKLGGLIKRKWGKETAKHAERAGAQSSVGLVRRGEDRGKEDSIARDKRLGSAARMTKGGKVHKQDTATLKGNIKRRLGSHTKPGHLPEETMDEAAYSAKAARAGKDIGKPGKMFSKIASKAGERYGSEERGKKVAGAILKRIRAKHMKEDAINEAPIVPASALKPGQSLRDYLNAKQGLTRRETPAAKPSSAPTPPARPTMGSDLPTIDKGPAPGPASTPQTAAATASAKPSAPMPPSRPSGVGTSEPGADASKFVRSQLKESVQVGENNYRIV